MRPLLSLLLIVPTLALAGDKLFQSPPHGLAMRHPDNWTFKQKKSFSEFTIPIAEGRSQARVEIFENTFRTTAADWQTLQETVAKDMKRTVERQWSEDLLGVPLLMTKVNYTEKAFEMSSLTGLLFTRTNVKFQFRMVVPAGSYDEAETLWKEALLTLQTIDGNLPQPEDPEGAIKRPVGKPVKGEKPEKASSTNAAAPEKPRPTIVMHSSLNKPQKSRPGSESLPLTVSGKEATLRFASGWTVEKQGEKFRFSHTKVKGSILVEALTPIDSPEAERQLILAPASTFGAFTKIGKRVDSPAVRTDAGYKLSTIWRDGESAQGPLFILHGVAQGDGNYWLMEYRNTSLKAYSDERKTIEQLMNSLAIEFKS